MLKHQLQTYLDAAPDHEDIGVTIFSVETDCEIATTFDITVDFNEYDQLIISVAIEQ